MTDHIRPLLTPAQAAALLGGNSSYVRYLVDNGRLTGVGTGSTLRVYEGEVHALLASRPEPAEPPRLDPDSPLGREIAAWFSRFAARVEARLAREAAIRAQRERDERATVADMPSAEDQQLVALATALKETTAPWGTLIGTPEPAKDIATGSDLADDDAATEPYLMHGAAWTAILAAVTHLVCLRESLFTWTSDTHVAANIYPNGQPSLIRGALENASRAVWLLESDDRATRVLRRLQQEYMEVRALEAVKKVVGGPPSGRPLKKRLEGLQLLATAAGADPEAVGQWPGYAAIVKVAGAHVPSGPKVAYVVWRACSALAHGDYRGMIAYLPNEVVAVSPDGMLLNRVSGNVQLLASGTMATMATTGLAFDLYRRRGGTSV